MAAPRMEMMVVLIVAVAAANSFWGGAVVAQQSNSCTNVLISMSPCLDYITGNSTKPSSSCCSQLSNVVRSQPQCLCQVVNGGGGSSSLGIDVNQTQAMALPSACNVQAPPVSRCSGSSSPTGSPPGTTNSPSGSGSKNVPDVDTSNGNATSLTFSLLVMIFIASCMLLQPSSPSKLY